jgi:formylglycine-generating enzyme
MKPKRICSPVSALLVAAVIFFGGALPAKAMEFVLIPGGTFTMGSPAGEVDRSSNETQHQVKVSDFYIAEYEVTVAEFRKFVNATRYLTDAEEKGDGSWIWDGTKWEKRAGVNWRHGISGTLRPQNEENHPVVHVSWNDAVAYCKALSAKTGKKYRLPTEAEWEYACRAGSRTPFNTGQNLTTGQSNYNGNGPYNNNPKGVYRQNTVAVNSFAPNRFGLYNMHGNVWEWCSDWYSETYYDECKAQGVVTNPTGPSTRSYRVIRGGSWNNPAELCRSAYRDYYAPDDRNSIVGFRPVFVP